jgi:hypothetical protein
MKSMGNQEEHHKGRGNISLVMGGNNAQPSSSSKNEWEGEKAKGVE